MEASSSFGFTFFDEEDLLDKTTKESFELQLNIKKVPSSETLLTGSLPSGHEPKL